jgi:hypothetical protein
MRLKIVEKQILPMVFSSSYLVMVVVAAARQHLNLSLVPNRASWTTFADDRSALPTPGTGSTDRTTG